MKRPNGLGGWLYPPACFPENLLIIVGVMAPSRDFYSRGLASEFYPGRRGALVRKAGRFYPCTRFTDPGGTKSL